MSGAQSWQNEKLFLAVSFDGLHYIGKVRRTACVCLPVCNTVKSLIVKLLCDPWTGSAKAWRFIRIAVELPALLLFVGPAETPAGKDFHLLFYSWENRGLSRFESMMQSPTCPTVAQELLVPIMERFPTCRT